MAWRLLAFTVAFAAAACSGGGGGGPAGQPGPFAVTQIVPGDAAQNVPLTQEISVIFSRPVRGTTVHGQSFVVEAESGDQILGFRQVQPFNQNVVRFIPDNGYLPFAVHRVRINRDIQDQQGTPLDQEYTFEFQAEQAGPVLPTQQDVEDLGPLLRVGRHSHRMTLVPSLSRFLVTGGYGVDGQPALSTAENLIPVLRQSSILSSSLREGRAGHVQVLLQDGRILVAGGEASSNPFVPLASCEIFDPDPQVFAFSRVAPMNFARSFAHAVVLPDGRVFVSGGQGVDLSGVIFRADAEIYDPATDTWTVAPGVMAKGRSAHFSTLTPVGDVVIIGGTLGDPSATLFRAATGQFSAQIGTPFVEHFFAAATTLPDGVGTSAATIWSPQFGFLGGINSLVAERSFATATALQDGRVFIIGGFDLKAVPPLVHGTMDVFFPIGDTGKVFRVAGVDLPRPTSHHAAAVGPDGAVWLTGGIALNAGLPAHRQVTVIRPGD